MADEIPTELRPAKRMALTQKEIALVLRHREAQEKVDAERKRVGKILTEWAALITSDDQPIHPTDLFTMLPELADQIVPPFEG